MLIETILGLITGIGGNVVSGIFKHKTAKLELQKTTNEQAHEVAMVKAESDAMIMESKANIAITKANIEGEIEVADSNVYLQSQKEGNKSFFDNKWIDKLFAVEGRWRIITYPIGSLVAVAFGFIDFLRGIIRPTLTAYLVGLTTYITFLAWDVMEAAGLDLFTPEAAQEIFSNVTSIIIYLTVSCVTWWYGDRRMSKTIMETQKKPEKNQDVTI